MKNLSSIIDLSPNVIVSTDLEGIINFISSNALDVFKYSDINELLNTSIYNLFSFDELSNINDFVLSNINHLAPGFIKIWIKKNDGSFALGEISISYLKNSDYENYGLIYIIREIENNAENDKSTQDYINVLQSLIDSSVDAIIYTDLKGKILSFSNHALFIFGYSKIDEIYNASIFDLIHPDDRVLALMNFKKRIDTQIKKSFEYRMLKSDGEIIYAEVAGSILKSFNNEPIGIVYIARDISDRRNIQIELEKSQKRYQLLVECALEGIVVIQNNKIEFHNNKINQLIRKSDEEIKNCDFIDFIYDEDKEKAYNYHMARLEGLEVPSSYELRLICNDYIRWVEVSGVSIEWNNASATLNFINDISEKKEAEEDAIKLYEDLQYSKHEIETNLYEKNTLVEELSEIKESLEKANATKDKFFSIIAHDLKNPLGNFKAVTKLLFESYNDLTEEDKLEFLDLLRTSSNNIYSLLENLLEWSRSQRGKIQFNPSTFNLKQLVDMTFDLLSLSAENKKIKLLNQISDQAILTADKNLITTVIRNLTSNSIKFTPENGSISISFEINKDESIVRIKDTGVGMSQEKVGKLFRIDSNVSTLGTSQEQGTGLGLILCKEFIDMHKGRIWAESEENNGSTFCFAIPNNIN